MIMSGAHALRHPWRKWVIFFVAFALAIVPWFLGSDRAGAAPADRAAGSVSAGVREAAAVFPGEDACHATSNASPTGDCGPFKLLYRDSFNKATAPVGTFSECGGDYDHQCQGAAGTRYYATLGAYPNGWPDTATSGADGNTGRTFGGYYRPQNTMSVVKQSNGDGQMRVKMSRASSGGSVRSSAPVPLKCMNLRYGKFTERLVVRTTTPGYKMAHLHYSPDEIDYPEAGGNFATDPVYAYTHGFSNENVYVAPHSAWTKWHTYSTEITPNRVKIYFDNKLIKTINGDYPRATPWVLQNESALAGSYAAPGSSVTIDTTWINCFSYSP